MTTENMPLTRAAIRRAEAAGFSPRVMAWLAFFLAGEGCDDAWVAGDIDAMVAEVALRETPSKDGWKGAA